MGTGGPKLVLVVDDDAAVRTLVATALKAHGYEIIEAADGLQASEMLGSMSRQPDLLICDVMMPVIDGFSLVRLIKARTELKAMPIIFLTARSQPSDLVQGISLGARHFVTKPFKIQELIDKVAKSLA